MIGDNPKSDVRGVTLRNKTLDKKVWTSILLLTGVFQPSIHMAQTLNSQSPSSSLLQEEGINTQSTAVMKSVTPKSFICNDLQDPADVVLHGVEDAVDFILSNHKHGFYF